MTRTDVATADPPSSLASGVRRTLRRSAMLLLLALAVAAAIPSMVLAAPPVAHELPRFYIESLVVEGAQRVAPEWLVAETLLEPEQTYSEADLRAAVYRLQRLPFVLEADFALGRGSERGRYELQITVLETQPFFFSSTWATTLFIEEILEPERYRDSESSTQLGWRFFVGRSGVMFAAFGLEGDNLGGSAQVGFTQYNLFDRGIFLGLTLAKNGCCETAFPLGLDPTFSQWNTEDAARASITLGVPLDRNQSLRLALTDLASSDRQGRRLLQPELGATLAYETLRHRNISLSWNLDTTDDPLFPSRGMELAGGLELGLLEVELLPEAGTESSLPSPATTMDNQFWRAFASVSRHFPLSRRTTTSVGARVASGHSEIRNLPVGPGSRISAEDLEVSEFALSSRLSLDLLPDRRQHHWGELRWETNGVYSYSHLSPDLGLANGELEQATLTTSLALRNRWGVLRLSLSFVSFEKIFT